MSQIKEFGHISPWRYLPLPSAHIWEHIGFCGSPLCLFWLLRSYKDTLHGRSVGIRTRGLLVPKVGRIFLADMSGHFCAFLLGKFHSGILSDTDKSA